MKKFVKIFAYVIVFSLCGLFILRCIMVADTSVFSKPIMTDEMKSAYSDTTADGFVMTVKEPAEISSSGYFRAYSFYYVPSANQAQLTVRWNKSVYSYTDMEPGTEFSFVLCNETTGARYPGTCVEAKNRYNMYDFRRLVFDGVSFGPDDQIVVIMELRDDHTDQQTVRHGEQAMTEYKLSKSNKTALGGN